MFFRPRIARPNSVTPRPLAALLVLALACMSSQTHGQPMASLPDGIPALGKKQISRAWLADPTSRYAHGALGDDIEAGALIVNLRSGRQHVFRLPETSVFEDLRPRLVDLDQDGADEVVVIRAYENAGGAVSVFKADDAGIRLWAESPAIGIANRWLNIAGFGDFDGDGRLEIAHVQTPHIGGILIISRVEEGRWVELTRDATGAGAGISNHAYLSRELGLSAVFEDDPGERHALVLPDQSRTDLVVASMREGALEFTHLDFGHEIRKVELTADGVKVTAQSGVIRTYKNRILRAR